eukprot:COSAG01_NODE_1940_length_8843_cov_65.051235_8_plen_144_part_00
MGGMTTLLRGLLAPQNANNNNNNTTAPAPSGHKYNTRGELYHPRVNYGVLRRTPIQKKKNKNRRALRIKLQVPGPDAASRTAAAPRRQVLYPEALHRAHQTVRNLQATLRKSERDAVNSERGRVTLSFEVRDLQVELVVLARL